MVDGGRVVLAVFSGTGADFSPFILYGLDGISMTAVELPPDDMWLICIAVDCRLGTDKK